MEGRPTTQPSYSRRLLPRNYTVPQEVTHVSNLKGGHQRRRETFCAERVFETNLPKGLFVQKGEFLCRRDFWCEAIPQAHFAH